VGYALQIAIATAPESYISYHAIVINAEIDVAATCALCLV
jgi:hypothetical protein